jgi:TolB protein
MDDASFRIGRIHATCETIRLLRSDARHGEQTGRFIEDDQPVIEVENGWQHWKNTGSRKGKPLKNGKRIERTDRLGTSVRRVMNPTPDRPTGIDLRRRRGAFSDMSSSSMVPACVLSLAVFSTLQSMAQSPEGAGSADWKTEEAVFLDDPVQLTFHDRFLKAGESYFSPDGNKVIFQAVEQTSEMTPDDFYAMFVADTVRDESGKTRSLENIRKISPEGSANTCGWFHPIDPNIVIFGTTMSAPTENTPPGYQRGSGRYRWMFPPEMRIVAADLRTADGTAGTLDPLVGDGTSYTAEGSFSPDGRFLLYTSLESGQGDIFIKDLATGKITTLIEKPGYDGGPFFSPDGQRITYRSDRHANNLLQVFVADLAFDEGGAITGVDREIQITDDANVNWCPFWHPDGKRMVFATSAVSHRNYEVFLVDAAQDDEAMPPSMKYGSGMRRITFGPAADVLPAFNADGSEMIWTCKRGANETSQLWVAGFIADLASPSAMPAGAYGRPSSEKGTGEK